jgi:hypothetical protein
MLIELDVIVWLLSKRSISDGGGDLLERQVFFGVLWINYLLLFNCRCMQWKIKQSISEISSTTKNKKENNFGDNINRNNVMGR